MTKNLVRILTNTFARPNLIFYIYSKSYICMVKNLIVYKCIEKILIVIVHIACIQDAT